MTKVIETYRNRWDVVERLLLAVLTLCAAFTVGLAVRREAASQRTDQLVERGNKPVYVKDWKLALTSTSVLSDKESEEAVLLLVSDYECPACAQFEVHRITLDSLPVDINVVHLPIRRHRFARSSAIAARCAEEQGRFREYHTLLFTQQDSIGLLSFVELAGRAGVGNSTRFEECQTSLVVQRFVDGSSSFAVRLGAEATPTLILNGWRYPRTPTLDVLRADLGRLRQGQPPVGTVSAP